jgi:hypothetical protein
MRAQSKHRAVAAKQLAVLTAVCGFSLWLPAQVMAQDAASAPAAAPAASASASGAVDTENGQVSFIDKKNAIVVVTMDGGQQLSLNAKKHEELLDKLKVGDKVAIRYQEPTITTLTPAKGTKLTRLAPIVTIMNTQSSATDSGFSATRSYQGVAEVAKIDTKLNMLTIIDKTGVARSIQVSDPALLDTMRSLKRRDHIHIAYRSTFTVNIAH